MSNSVFEKPSFDESIEVERGETYVAAQQAAGELVKSWKVTSGEEGVILVLNGRKYLLGSSFDSIAFDLNCASLLDSCSGEVS